MFGWRGAAAYFSAEKKNKTKRKHQLSSQTSFTALLRVRDRSFTRKSHQKLLLLLMIMMLGLWALMGNDRDPQRPLVSTVQNSVEIQSAWGGLLPPYAQSPWLLSLFFNHQTPPNPPPRKKNKQKEKPKLNIFSSFNLKYTSKIFGQIFKSNPNEKENVKKRWAGGVIRNISIK